VAVARALVTRPDALLVDEGTNQLDPASVLVVEDLLRRERDAGRAVALVTHSVSQARRVADRVAFLDGGRVVEEGPAREVLAAPRSEGLRAFLRAA
jgi:polar amino acid transport system ATP-binding protein